MVKLVNRSLFPLHWCAIHFHLLFASHSHYLSFFPMSFDFCMVVESVHWTPFCFCFHFLIAPLPLIHTLQAASQSKAQKKLQPLTQVPVLQEQGEYCGFGGIWTWVPAVWLRGLLSFPFILQSSLSFHLSTHLWGWTVAVSWHRCCPFLTVPETPHMPVQP